jgi:hypothetical protein
MIPFEPSAQNQPGRTMKKLIQHVIPLLACLMWSASTPGQGVPPLINYQGQLLDASGNPMPTGNYDVEVRLFPVESGGAALWGPQVFNGQSGTGYGPKVAVVQGRFNLVLGPQDTGAQDLATVFAANPSVYIELKVGTANPISPRQQVLSAPFALNAANATNSFKLNGYDWGALFSGADPQNGNMGVGTAPSEVRLDVNGQARIRQGTNGLANFGAGLWYSQTNGGDKAFVGMMDDSSLGFGLPSGGRPMTYNLDSGLMYIPGYLSLGSYVLYTNFLHVVRTGFVLNGFHYHLHVDEEDSVFSGNVSAVSFTTTSDERLKENIQTIQDPLEKLNSLRGVAYNLKGSSEAGSAAEPPKRRMGVLAQEVQKVLPEAVQTRDDGYLAVEYSALTPVLIEAVKAQQKEIEELKAELQALKSRRP